MRIRVITQINGNFYIGDVDDEDAPLLEVHFRNEFKLLDEASRCSIAMAVLQAVKAATQNQIERRKRGRG